jgi:hypothetical protein
VPVVVDGRFYATFAIGLVTIQLLQLVHFGKRDGILENLELFESQS